jgi:hypothetical protein
VRAIIRSELGGETDPTIPDGYRYFESGRFLSTVRLPVVLPEPSREVANNDLIANSRYDLCEIE